MLIEASVGLSVALNVLAVELIGFSAGGVVVPGYLALYLDQPVRLLATFAAAFVTLGAVSGLSRVTVLYGRRRFAAMLLLGFLVNAGMSWLLTAVASTAPTGAGLPDLRAIGYLVPGLLANEMSRQGVLVTVAMTLIVTIAIRLLLNYFFGPVAGTLV